MIARNIVLAISAFLVSSSVFASDPVTAAKPCPKHAGLTLDHDLKNTCIFEGVLKRRDPVDPSQKRDIPFRYYFSRDADAKAPLVLVYPALSEDLPLVEAIISKRLAKEKFHAIIMELVEDIADVSRPPESINDFFTRSNWGTHEVLDVVTKWKEIDTKFIHAMGVSLGGIRAMMSYVEEPRLKRLITYVAGGNLPEIFAHTVVTLLVEYRDHWKTKLGLTTDEEFADYLRGVLKVDPLWAAKKRSARNDIYMVIGEKDIKVPFKHQIELYEALGRPKARFSPNGHRVTGGSVLVKFKEVTDFLSYR